MKGLVNPRGLCPGSVVSTGAFGSPPCRKAFLIMQPSIRSSTMFCNSIICQGFIYCFRYDLFIHRLYKLFILYYS